MPISDISFSLASAAISFLVGLVLGHPFVRFLREHQIRKRIREDGPSSHLLKAGTPTMGGLIVCVPAILLSIPTAVGGRLSVLFPTLVLGACAVLGAVDDWLTLSRRATRRNGDAGTEAGGDGKAGETRREGDAGNGSTGRGEPAHANGLTMKFKFAWLIAVGLAAGWAMYALLQLDTVYFPSVKSAFQIGAWTVPLAALAIVATANAVNLSDGLDSLAGHTCAVAFAAYGIIAYLQHQTPLVTFSFTVVGGLLAFLWFNAHPAEVFMGDTGSLALGAALAVVAMMTGHVLLLPIIGIVFVMEAASVMLQVAYYRWTGGRRLFKMAPLHHHFELLGWSESQVAQRLWLISMLAAIVGIALALI